MNFERTILPAAQGAQMMRKRVVSVTSKASDLEAWKYFNQRNQPQTAAGKYICSKTM